MNDNEVVDQALAVQTPEVPEAPAPASVVAIVNPDFYPSGAIPAAPVTIPDYIP